MADPTASDDPVRIDVISDFVCPWCWIGKRGVDAFALRRKVERTWRPYFLHPGIPAEGMERKALMQMKFGPDGVGKDAVAAIASAADAVGLDINYDRVERVPNTRDAHRLSLWAATKGRADDVAEALFAAYFNEGRDIGSRDVLAAIGSECGLDGAWIASLLESDTDVQIVEDAAEDLRARGIPGVPSHLIGGKGFLVGAQSPEAFETATARLEA